MRTVSKVKKSLGFGAFKEALDHMPPGIIDEKSWYYWNTIMDRYPVPPLPERTFS
ncbi:MAG TPA: hypothetical protein PLY23_02155 [Alphaproteobacteria bacterium]|nr:hypothetical protein [Alphaproteobacteria bacterium]HQS93468.1 hypothetical protein [Alphaproteobacteria bacterium]